MVENKDIEEKSIKITKTGVKKVAKSANNTEILTDIDAPIKVKPTKPVVKDKPTKPTVKEKIAVDKVVKASSEAKEKPSVKAEIAKKTKGSNSSVLKKDVESIKPVKEKVAVIASTNGKVVAKSKAVPKSVTSKKNNAVKQVVAVDFDVNTKSKSKNDESNIPSDVKVNAGIISIESTKSSISKNASNITKMNVDVVFENISSDNVEDVVVAESNKIDLTSCKNADIASINKEAEDRFELVSENVDDNAKVENVDDNAKVENVDDNAKTGFFGKVATFFKKIAKSIVKFGKKVEDKALKVGRKICPFLRKVKHGTYAKVLALVMVVLLVILMGNDLPLNLNRDGVKIKVLETISTPQLNEDGSVNEAIEPEVKQIVKSTLRANLYVGSRVDGVILFGGINSSQSKLKSMAKLFFEEGLTVMTVDLSGSGESSGVSTFNNIDYGQMVAEMEAVINEFSILTNLSIKNTILLGHSEGARGILQLLASNIIDDNFKMIYLLAPMVDYDNFVLPEDSSLYTSEQIFLNSINSNVLRGTKTVLIPAYSDENFSASSTAELYRRLSGNVEYVEKTNNAFENLVVYNVKGVAHEMIPYSSAAASIIKDTLRMTLPLEKTNSISGYTFKINAIVISLFLFVGLLALVNLAMKKKFDYTNQNQVVLSNVKLFLSFKLAYVAIGAIIGTAIGLLGMALPFGAPASTLVFVGSVAGYGISMLAFYRTKLVSGVAGKFSFEWKNCSITAYVISAIIVLIAAVYLSLLLNIGLYKLYSPNIRMLYLVVFTVLMAVGFFFYEYEGEMMTNAKASLKAKAIYNIEVFAPIIILLLINLFSGSFSALLANLFALIILKGTAFLGKIVKKMTGNKVIGAVAAAFVFCSVIISMASMFKF